MERQAQTEAVEEINIFASPEEIEAMKRFEIHVRGLVFLLCRKMIEVLVYRGFPRVFEGSRGEVKLLIFQKMCLSIGMR